MINDGNSVVRILVGTIVIFALACFLSYCWTNEPEWNALSLGFPVTFYRQFQVEEDFINHSSSGEPLLIDLLFALFISYTLNTIYNRWRKAKATEKELSEHLINN